MALTASTLITVISTHKRNADKLWEFKLEAGILSSIKVINHHTREELRCDFSDFALHFTLLFKLIGIADCSSSLG